MGDDNGNGDDDGEEGKSVYPGILVKAPGNRKAARVVKADVPLSNSSTTIVHVISAVLLP